MTAWLCLRAWLARLTWRTREATLDPMWHGTKLYGGPVEPPRVQMTHGGIVAERPIVRLTCRDCGEAHEATRSDLSCLIGPAPLLCFLCGGACWHIGGLLAKTVEAA